MTDGDLLDDKILAVIKAVLWKDSSDKRANIKALQDGMAGYGSIDPKFIQRSGALMFIDWIDDDGEVRHEIDRKTNKPWPFSALLVKVNGPEDKWTPNLRKQLRYICQLLNLSLIHI